jgi:hypothetical protein
MPETAPPSVLDRRQLERIQSVHRGFLYQHLYAAACLLQAGASATTVVRVDPYAVRGSICRVAKVGLKSSNSVVRPDIFPDPAG